MNLARHTNAFATPTKSRGGSAKPSKAYANKTKQGQNKSAQLPRKLSSGSSSSNGDVGTSSDDEPGGDGSPPLLDMTRNTKLSKKRMKQKHPKKVALKRPSAGKVSDDVGTRKGTPSAAQAKNNKGTKRKTKKRTKSDSKRHVSEVNVASRSSFTQLVVIVAGVATTVVLAAYWIVQCPSVTAPRDALQDAESCSNHGDRMVVETKRWLLTENTLAASREEKMAQQRLVRGQEKLSQKNYPTAHEQNIPELLEFVDLHDPTDPHYLAVTGTSRASVCICYRGWTGPTCNETFVSVSTARQQQNATEPTIVENASNSGEAPGCEAGRTCTRDKTPPLSDWSGDATGFMTVDDQDADVSTIGDEHFWIKADFLQYRHRSIGGAMVDAQGTNSLGAYPPAALPTLAVEQALNPHMMHHHAPPASVQHGRKNKKFGAHDASSSGRNGDASGGASRGGPRGRRNTGFGGTSSAGGYASNALGDKKQRRTGRGGRNNVPAGAVTE